MWSRLGSPESVQEGSSGSEGISDRPACPELASSTCETLQAEQPHQCIELPTTGSCSVIFRAPGVCASQASIWDTTQVLHTTPGPYEAGESHSVKLFSFCTKSLWRRRLLKCQRIG